MLKNSSGICEMCGHNIYLRQKAHIVSEQKAKAANLLMLCPTCHLMFDTHLKPKMYACLLQLGVTGLPKSWKSSIYDQAAEASARVLKKS